MMQLNLIKIRRLIAVLAIALFLFYSGNAFSQDLMSNKFMDTTLQLIHELGDQRDGEGLLPFLQDSNMNYRGEALYCLGSIQDPGLIDTIFSSMNVDSEGVRMMGSFALGQTKHPAAVPFIRQQLDREQSPLVRGMLFEALGQCGNQEDLDWMTSLTIPIQESEGMIAGILKFGMRGITTVKGNEQLVALMKAGTSQVGMIYGSYYLGRYAGMDWLQQVPEPILELYQNEPSPEVRSNLIKAVIRALDEEAWPYVNDILTSGTNEKMVINTLNSLVLIPWNKAVKPVLNRVEGDNYPISVAAAEAVMQLGVYTDLPDLLKTIDKTGHWRSRSLLLAKALELVYGKRSLMKRVEKMIWASVQEAGDSSEKAGYLNALAADPMQYVDVEQILKGAKESIVATAATETLIAMRRHPNFGSARDQAEKTGVNLDQEFLRLFTMAIRSGDMALVAMGSGILRDPEMGFQEWVNDVGFLEQALARMNHPSQIEAYIELTRALAYFQGKSQPLIGPPVFNHPIDWDYVTEIPRNQRIVINTTQGEVLVQLHVNWCPGTVAGFLQLVESGFYDGKTIHRVVPNFVMQDGCPRGDGWGGPDFTLRSELSPMPFLEGTLGMASSGKDTEGSQWYITLSATPHLNGQYTHFGTVISGMEVVRKLEVGDRILEIERVKSEE